jgi:glycosyltransferase involved in cell wall biosynthesis
MHISVVITCHNEEAYIEQCVNSVVTQSDYQDIKEIFVVDDGSTDNSPKLLAQLKLNCNKLKVITTKGLGLPAARNIAIKSASSEFIAFLDADDFWTKNKLQNQLKAFKNNPLIGLVYGDIWDFKKSDASDAKYISVRSLNRFHTNQLVEYFIKDAPIIPSTTICRKEVFETVGLFNEQFTTSEDTEMYLRVAEKWKFFHVQSADCYKRKKEGQITHKLEKLLNNQNKISAIAISRNPYLKKFAKKRESYRNVKVGIDCLIRHKEKKKTFTYAIKSLKLNPLNFRAWALLIMVALPYKILTKIYNFIRDKFYQLRRRKNNKS